MGHALRLATPTKPPSLAGAGIWHGALLGDTNETTVSGSITTAGTSAFGILELMATPTKPPSLAT
jgi:hypothetical protein